MPGIMIPVPYGNAWPGWDAQLLHAIGAPDTPSNRAVLAEWHAHEGSSAGFNPINTTWDPTGSTYPAINSDGVRSYPSQQAGIAATANTLLHSPASYGYGPIVAALRASANPNRIGQLVGASSWGTPAFNVGAPSTWGTPATVISAGAGPFGGGGILGPHGVVGRAGHAVSSGVTGAADAVSSGVTGAADAVGNAILHGILYAALLGLAVVLAIFGLMQLAGVNRQQLAETFRAATPAVAA